MRTIRYVAMLPIAAVALALASCGPDTPTAPVVARALHALTASGSGLSPTVVYGPATYKRDTGKPRTDTVSFLARAGDSLTVVLSSGASQGLNATVELNGSPVYSTSSGRTVPDTIHMVARATNTLRVWMGGKPGSTLQIVATTPAPVLPPETRTLSVLYGSGVLGLIPPGTVDVPLGTLVRYNFTPSAGFRHLGVVIDGRPAPDSGTLVMDGTHWMVASADTVIALDGTEQPLALQLRSVLTSSTPRDDWLAYQAGLDVAVTAWGDQADLHLARIELATIDPVADLPNILRLDSALAGLTRAASSSSATALIDNGAPRPMRSSMRSRAALGDSLPTWAPEKTEILLVNGILNSRDGFGDNYRLLRGRLNEDPVRFPPETHLTSIYSPSFLSGEPQRAAAAMCLRGASVEFRLRNTERIAHPSMLASYLGCIARAGWANFDYVEMVRWAQEATAGTYPNDIDVTRMAAHMHNFLHHERRHVLVVGHSEGSLLTQLAVRRLIAESDFREDTSSRCIGTVSIAGVGTTNWPLSDRHARFVVAAHDLVTTGVMGSLRNPRRTVEDADTRVYEMMLGEIPPDSTFTLTSAYSALVHFGPLGIHQLDRYLRSPEMWSLISDDLHELYNTCAIGTVLAEPPAATIQLFGAKSFAAKWYALDGQALNTADSVTWTVDGTLASVSQSGRLVAGGAPGTVSLQAKVRQVTGSSTIAIVNDSVRATYLPPVINNVTTRRQFYNGYAGGPGSGSSSGPSPELLPPSGMTWWMTVSASAMPGASISKVEVFRRTRATPPVEMLAWSGPPVDGEIPYQGLPWNSDGTQMAELDAFLRIEDFSWFRVVVTDSHGLTAEYVGTSVDPPVAPPVTQLTAGPSRSSFMKSMTSGNGVDGESQREMRDPTSCRLAVTDSHGMVTEKIGPSL